MGGLAKERSMGAPVRSMTGLLVLALVAAGWATEEELVIVPRTVEKVKADPLTAAVRVLGGDEAQQDERSQALRTIAKATDPAGDKVVNHMDSAKHSDWAVRRGAIRSLQALGVSGPRVSSALAWTAAHDGEAKVRDEAVSMIKTRGDRTATELIGRYLVESYSDRGLVLNATVIDYSVGALRSVGDRRVAESILGYYVTLEVQAAQTSFNNMRSRTMRSVVPQGDNAATSVNLPIEFPEIGVNKTRTTVVVPAACALGALTGQNFGDDQAQWQRWIRSHPVSDWK
jgi:hypothetical protein